MADLHEQSDVNIRAILGFGGALIVVAAVMISVNFTLSSFAVWLEGRMRRSRRGPAPLHIAPVTQGAFGAGAGGTI